MHNSPFLALLLFVMVYRFVFALISKVHGDAFFMTIPMVAFQNTWESMTCQTISKT
jgi:hypothetical protein